MFDHYELECANIYQILADRNWVNFNLSGKKNCQYFYEWHEETKSKNESFYELSRY
ncbi:MAG: hypothetical protein ACI9LY_001877, partial [Arenicella sp.]